MRGGRLVARTVVLIVALVPVLTAVRVVLVLVLVLPVGILGNIAGQGTWGCPALASRLEWRRWRIERLRPPCQ